ncbi:MAG: hypothetical protein HGN29_17880 [Asgard group archaeon]|nr:hypothetical protein [Asgard group archaeon]
MKMKILGFYLSFVILISSVNISAINKPVEKQLEPQYMPVHYRPNDYFVNENFFFERTSSLELTISDISNPYSRKYISSYSINDTEVIANIVFVNDTMYILYYDEIGAVDDYDKYLVSYALELVNITDIYNPIFLSKLDFVGINGYSFHDIEISDGYFYLITQDTYDYTNYVNYVHIVNCTDILNPNIVVIYSINEMWNCWIEIRNDIMFALAYHSDSNSSLTIWDISNKTGWERLYLEIFYDISMQELFLQENYLFFFSNNYESDSYLFQYDISNLSDALLVRTIQFNPDDEIVSLNFWDDYLGVVSRSGFRTYHLDALETNQSLDYFGSFIKDRGYFYDGIYDNFRIYASRLSFEKANRIFFILDVTDPFNIQMIYPKNPYVLWIVPPVVIITSIVGLIVTIMLIKRRRKSLIL